MARIVQGTLRMPIRILYAEDNPLVLGIVKEMLEMEHWTVDVCEEGNSALEKLKSQDHYDLVLLDVDLPGVNGVDLVKAARHLPHRREIPIVVMSADEAEMEARRAGADEFLRKPLDIYRIVEPVKRLVPRAFNSIS